MPTDPAPRTPRDNAVHWINRERENAFLLMGVVEKYEGTEAERAIAIAKVLCAHRASLWVMVSTSLDEAAKSYEIEAALSPVRTRKTELAGGGFALKTSAINLRQEAALLMLGLEALMPKPKPQEESETAPARPDAEPERADAAGATQSARAEGPTIPADEGASPAAGDVIPIPPVNDSKQKDTVL